MNFGSQRLGFIAALLFLLLSFTVQAKESITVGIFYGWPSPGLVGLVDRRYVVQMGVKINWVAFETSYDMNKAFASGDLDISFSHEMVPFMDAVSKGIDIVATGIAVSYPGHDRCALGNDSGISRFNITELEGNKIALQLDGITHFRMEKMLQHLGVDVSKVSLVEVGDSVAAVKAMSKGKTAAACAFGGPAIRMLDHGIPLMSDSEMENIGLHYFDFITMRRSFLEKNMELARQFMDITEKLNSEFLIDPGSKKKNIAAGSNLNVMTVNRFMRLFSFPSRELQLSSRWLGQGGVGETYMVELGKFLNNKGKLGENLLDYSPYFETSFLK